MLAVNPPTRLSPPPPPTTTSNTSDSSTIGDHGGRRRPDRLIAHHAQDLDIDDMEVDDVQNDGAHDGDDDEEEEEIIMIRPRRRFMKSGMTSYEKWISKNAMGRRRFHHLNGGINIPRGMKKEDDTQMQVCPSLTPPSSSSTLASVIKQVLDGQTEALSHVDDSFETFPSPKAYVVEQDPTGGEFYVRSFRIDPHVRPSTINGIGSERAHSLFTTPSEDFMMIPSGERLPRPSDFDTTTAGDSTFLGQRPSFHFHGSSGKSGKGRRIKRALGLNKLKQRSSLSGGGGGSSSSSSCDAFDDFPYHQPNSSNRSHRDIKSILKPMNSQAADSSVSLAESEGGTVIMGMNMYDQDLPLLDQRNNDTFMDEEDQEEDADNEQEDQEESSGDSFSTGKLKIPSIIQEDQEMTTHADQEDNSINSSSSTDEDDDGITLNSFKNVKDIDFQRRSHTEKSSSSSSSSASPAFSSGSSNGLVTHHNSLYSTGSNTSLLGYKSGSANRLAGHDDMINRMKTSRRSSKNQNSMSDLTRRLRDARSRIPYEFRDELPVKKTSSSSFLTTTKNKRVRFDMTRYCREFQVDSDFDESESESDSEEVVEEYHSDMEEL